MGVLEVDTAAVLALAGSVRALAEESQRLAGVTAPGRMSASGADPLVGAALERFLAAWRPSLGEIGSDVRRLADALALAARIYQDAELAAGTPLGLGR